MSATSTARRRRCSAECRNLALPRPSDRLSTPISLARAYRRCYRQLISCPAAPVDAKLYRRKGQLLLRDGHTEAAEKLNHKAFKIAREQEANSVTCAPPLSSQSCAGISVCAARLVTRSARALR